jgi:hypothetical protein
MSFRLQISALLFSLALFGSAQQLQKDKNYYISAIGFYNVENLYDTINDPVKLDEEFLPEGEKRWTGDRYWVKIDRLGEVISKMAADATPDGVAILCLCDIENKKVHQENVATPPIK